MVVKLVEGRAEKGLNMDPASAFTTSFTDVSTDAFAASIPVAAAVPVSPLVVTSEGPTIGPIISTVVVLEPSMLGPATLKWKLGAASLSITGVMMVVLCLSVMVVLLSLVVV